jgi:glycosyltransferase involved in cell wall biosynthesis
VHLQGEPTAHGFTIGGILSRGATTRIAIDGSALHDGSQFRGIGTYLRRLIEGLASYDDLTPVVLAKADTPLPVTADRVRIRRAFPARWHALEDDLRSARDVRRASAALLHSPAQSPPRHSPLPWVQTLHDLTPLVFDHPLYDRGRRRWESIGARLHDAAAVICVSTSSARQAQELLGIDSRRLHVVPLGVGAEFMPRPAASTPAEPYLLWVSAWGPHKGLAEATEVVSRLADQGHPHRLVVAGRQDEWMLARVHETVAAAAHPERVQVAGYVADLPALYRGATALLVTSRAEGFGLPAVEAMACGTPVVSFDNTSLPEVVDGGGVLVADGDVDAFTEAVRLVITDPGHRDDLRVRGPRQAARFSWERTVAQHVEIYRSVLGCA